MTIQERVTIYILPVLGLAFFLILLAINGLPASVDREIAQDLEELAINLTEYNSMRATELDQWVWPDNSIESAASFYLIYNNDNQLINQSNDLPNSIGILSDYLDVLPGCLGNSEEHEIDNETIRVLTYPLCIDNDDTSTLIGYLQVGRHISDYIYFRDLTKAVVFIIGASLFGALAALGLIIPRIFKPLTQISDVARQITSADDLSRRIEEPPAKDQISQLVRVLNRLMERLERLFRTQERLLGDVSHELRTPLTAIRGNVDLIRRTGKADLKSLDAIDAEAKRMSRLVDDLLTLARAESGGLPIEQKLLDLDRVVLQTYEQMLFLDSPVRVILGELDQIQVYGDEDRLKQLCLNLMTNGIKYTNPGGQVKVSLTLEQNNAVMRVTDTGLGIPADDLPHIFDRFYRVNKARTRKRGGAGLGLSIVKSIVDAHDGDISVTSQVGNGSTFTVTLPAVGR